MPGNSRTKEIEEWDRCDSVLTTLLLDAIEWSSLALLMPIVTTVPPYKSRSNALWVYLQDTLNRKSVASALMLITKVLAFSINWKKSFTDEMARLHALIDCVMQVGDPSVLLEYLWMGTLLCCMAP